MKTVLFLHGFFSSGSSDVAKGLEEGLRGQARLLHPDFSSDPFEALEAARSLIHKEGVDLLVGNSCGGMLAAWLSPREGIPALLGNPYLKMSAFLESRKGIRAYKAPRRGGTQTVLIDDALIESYKKVESELFEPGGEMVRGRVWGLFGEKDDLARFRDVFKEHFSEDFTFDGGHTPTFEQARDDYAPLAAQMLEKMAASPIGERYFRHFKGGMYRLVCSALDSETTERRIVYQALYGNRGFWVRPESMFFSKVIRDGKVYQRFTEVPKAEGQDF